MMPTYSDPKFSSNLKVTYTKVRKLSLKTQANGPGHDRLLTQIPGLHAET
jgi:hypothetical protein